MFLALLLIVFNNFGIPALKSSIFYKNLEKQTLDNVIINSMPNCNTAEDFEKMFYVIDDFYCYSYFVRDRNDENKRVISQKSIVIITDHYCFGEEYLSQIYQYNFLEQNFILHCFFESENMTYNFNQSMVQMNHLEEETKKMPNFENSQNTTDELLSLILKNDETTDESNIEIEESTSNYEKSVSTKQINTCSITKNQNSRFEIKKDRINRKKPQKNTLLKYVLITNHKKDIKENFFNEQYAFLYVENNNKNLKFVRNDDFGINIEIKKNLFLIEPDQTNLFKQKISSSLNNEDEGIDGRIKIFNAKGVKRNKSVKSFTDNSNVGSKSKYSNNCRKLNPMGAYNINSKLKKGVSSKSFLSEIILDTEIIENELDILLNRYDYEILSEKCLSERSKNLDKSIVNYKNPKINEQTTLSIKLDDIYDELYILFCNFIKSIKTEILDDNNSNLKKLENHKKISFTDTESNLESQILNFQNLNLINFCSESNIDKPKDTRIQNIEELFKTIKETLKFEEIKKTKILNDFLKNIEKIGNDINCLIFNNKTNQNLNPIIGDAFLTKEITPNDKSQDEILDNIDNFFDKFFKIISDMEFQKNLVENTILNTEKHASISDTQHQSTDSKIQDGLPYNNKINDDFAILTTSKENVLDPPADNLQKPEKTIIPINFQKSPEIKINIAKVKESDKINFNSKNKLKSHEWFKKKLNQQNLIRISTNPNAIQSTNSKTTEIDVNKNKQEPKINPKRFSAFKNYVRDKLFKKNQKEHLKHQNKFKKPKNHFKFRKANRINPSFEIENKKKEVKKSNRTFKTNFAKISKPIHEDLNKEIDLHIYVEFTKIKNSFLIDKSKIQLKNFDVFIKELILIPKNMKIETNDNAIFNDKNLNQSNVEILKLQKSQEKNPNILNFYKPDVITRNIFDKKDIEANSSSLIANNNNQESDFILCSTPNDVDKKDFPVINLSKLYINNSEDVKKSISKKTKALSFMKNSIIDSAENNRIGFYFRNRKILRRRLSFNSTNNSVLIEDPKNEFNTLNHKENDLKNQFKEKTKEKVTQIPLENIILTKENTDVYFQDCKRFEQVKNNKKSLETDTPETITKNNQSNLKNSNTDQVSLFENTKADNFYHLISKFKYYNIYYLNLSNDKYRCLSKVNDFLYDSLEIILCCLFQKKRILVISENVSLLAFVSHNINFLLFPFQTSTMFLPYISNLNFKMIPSKNSCYVGVTNFDANFQKLKFDLILNCESKKIEKKTNFVCVNIVEFLTNKTSLFYHLQNKPTESNTDICLDFVLKSKLYNENILKK